jgi:hypothetical protein
VDLTTGFCISTAQEPEQFPHQDTDMNGFEITPNSTRRREIGFEIQRKLLALNGRQP